MNRGLAMIVALLAWAGAGLAQEAKVRTSLDGTEWWVGQRIVLVVELLAPGYFSGAPVFDLPDPPGMLLLPPSGSPVVGTETIGETSYTVQRHELSVVPQRGGPQTIPPLTVRFAFKRQPLDKTAAAAVVKTEPVNLTIKTPPGTEKLGNVISARGLKLVETWKPEPGKAKAGDAFVRTIVFTAPDVPAMAFPPIPAPKIDGLGIYTKPPVVLDRDERGSLTGERRDTITYVCQRSGTFTIPAIRWVWWDLDSQTLQTVTLPARSFEVAANPALAEAKPAAAPSADWPVFLTSLAGALLASGCGILVWKTRAFWQRVLLPFRPRHLSPLNPVSQPKI